MKQNNILLGAILCFGGGAMDGYSYVMRGGVLATAQTANWLLLVLNLADCNWLKALNYLVPVISFITATCLAKFMYERIYQKNNLKWQEAILVITVFVFGVIGFLNEAVPAVLVNSVISFFAAMQYCAFRSFGEKEPYATIFCTGNMRSFSDNVYEGIAHKDKICQKRAVKYAIMLLSFALGVVCCHFLTKVVAYYSAWLVSVVLFVAYILLKRMDRD